MSEHHFSASDPNSGQDLSSLTDPIYLAGHRDKIFSLAWSPDGSSLASGGRDLEVRIWRRSDYSCLFVYSGQQAYTLSLAWSPDGQLLASGASDGTVHVWEPETGRLVQVYRGHKRFVRTVAWSPDGLLLASGGDFGDNTVQVWEARTGKFLFNYTNQYRIFALDWSPINEQLLATSFDGKIILRRPGTNDMLELPGQRGPLYCARWSPSGKLLAAAGEDCQVQIWQPDEARPRIIYGGHTEPIKCLAWLPSGKLIASAGEDNSIQLWDATTGLLHTRLTGHLSWIRALSLTPDGQLLASASSEKIQLQLL